MGVKSFALLDILLRSDILNEEHILVLDEPEVHLHPKWQVEYAKLIVQMVKNLNIKVLINSHSSYFIEAIQNYSEKFEIQNKTNFYLIKKKDNGNSIIEHIEFDETEIIYESLGDAYIIMDNDIENNREE